MALLAETLRDPFNCGGVGVRCASDEECVNGVCVRASTGSELASGPGVLAATGTWYERGPTLGGRLDGFVVGSGTDPMMFVGSPGGAVWRKLESAGSWSMAGTYALGDFSIMHLEWDVVTAGRLYALTWNTLRASTDGGNTWSALINPGAVPGQLLPWQVQLADPKPFAQLKFSSTQRAVFASYGCYGLHYSFDGATFTQHYPFSGGSSNPDNCIGNIAPDPVSRRVYFSTLRAVAGEPAHLYRSTCAWGPGSPCLTWEAANTGLPTGRVVASLVSMSYGAYADDLVALLVTTGSATETYWTSIGTSWFLRSSQSNQWTPRPLVYPGTGDELFQGNVRAFYSPWLGSTWSEFKVSSYEHVDVRAIYADAARGKVYTATDGAMNSGVYLNMTRWNWSPGSAPTGGTAVTYAGLRVWQTYYAGAVPRTGAASPIRVFLGSQDNGALCSDDAGLGWMDDGSPPAGDAIAIQFAPSNPNRAYARSNSGTIFYRSGNARAAPSCTSVVWTAVSPPGGTIAPSYWSRNIIAVHPNDLASVYFVFPGDVGASVNSGDCFTRSSLPGGVKPVSLFVESCGTRYATVYVGTQGSGAYYATYDGSACTGTCPCGTWSAWSPWGLNSGSPAVVWAIAGSGGASPTYWMATTSGLYRKLPAGAWTLVTGGAGYIVNDVEVDPSCPTRVYAALGYGGVRQQHRGGIHFSSDNGGTWTSITAGLDIHQAPVTDIEVDNVDSQLLFAASYGRGFWLYDWGSGLPACAP